MYYIFMVLKDLKVNTDNPEINKKIIKELKSAFEAYKKDKSDFLNKVKLKNG